jgi:hypothetical protein
MEILGSKIPALETMENKITAMKQLDPELKSLSDEISGIVDMSDMDAAAAGGEAIKTILGAEGDKLSNDLKEEVEKVKEKADADFADEKQKEDIAKEIEKIDKKAEESAETIKEEAKEEKAEEPEFPEAPALSKSSCYGEYSGGACDENPIATAAAKDALAKVKSGDEPDENTEKATEAIEKVQEKAEELAKTDPEKAKEMIHEAGKAAKEALESSLKE